MTIHYSQTAVEICDWLVQPSTMGSPEELFGQLNRRIEASGTPIFRSAFILLTMHPEVFSKQLVWRRGEAVMANLRTHEVIASSFYTDSPVAIVRRERVKMRLHIERDPDSLRYEVCRDIKAAGGTDYIILPVEYRNGAVGYASWSTDRAGGFTDAELALFEALIPTMSLRFEVENTKFATDSLLGTYLGGSAANRVVTGTFRRGQGQNIRAVIWTCDLRGFTQMVDSTPIADVLQSLDSYFACVAAPIMQRGGEILKYIGDAVLGIFPIDATDPSRAAQMALTAAGDAFRSTALCNQKRAAEGLPALHFGLALHVGDVMFGNIGTAGRLDFTVIGPAVNEASRVEAKCKELGHSILLTDAFVRVSGRSDFEPLGRIELRGVSNHLDLYTVDPATLA